MSDIDYTASAELYPGRRWGARMVGYQRFATLAEALKFANEVLAPEMLSGASLEAGDERYDASQIRALYQAEAYPLTRLAPEQR